MESVIEFINKLNLDINPRDNQSYSDAWLRVLRSLMHKKYNVAVCWDTSLFTLTANRYKTDFATYPALNHCFGLILRAPEEADENVEVVGYSYDVLREWSGNEETPFNFRVQALVDGPVVRVFWNGAGWQVGTLKRPDASKTNWASKKTFKDMFDEAGGVDLSKLNKDCTYTFAIRHTDNHMFVKYDKSSVVHICTYNVKEHKYVDENLGFNAPFEFPYSDWNSLKEACATPCEVPFTEKSVIGYVLINKDNPAERFIYESKEYSRARELKGNVPNINYQILNLQREFNFNAGSPIKTEFLSYFPQYEGNWDFVERRVNNTIKNLLTTYNEGGVTGNKNEMFNFLVTSFHYYTYEAGLNYVNFSSVKKFLCDQSLFKIAVATNTPYIKKQNEKWDLSNFAPSPNGNNVSPTK